MKHSSHFEDFTHKFAKWTGSGAGFSVGAVSIVSWCVAGKLYDFSPGWENALMIYVSVIMFLMLFLIQRSQLKDMTAIQLKLDELIKVIEPADNTLIRAEELSEKELVEAHKNHAAVLK